MTEGDRTIEDFVVESWRIEGEELTGSQLRDVAARHQEFIALPTVSVADLSEAAIHFTRGQGMLRALHGCNVVVGGHIPPAGGPQVARELSRLCRFLTAMTPFEAHQKFEDLHPFMDGNGRVGRMMWAWCMERSGRNWLRFPFLQQWYYDSLSEWRRPVISGWPESVADCGVPEGASVTWKVEDAPRCLSELIRCTDDAICFVQGSSGCIAQDVRPEEVVSEMRLNDGGRVYLIA